MKFPPIVIAALLCAIGSDSYAETRYVSPTGDDDEGNGSIGSPFATITRALDASTGGDTVIVQEGLYTGRVRIRGTFDPPVLVRSEPPYRARLRSSDSTVVTVYDAIGVTMDGFDIAHSGPGAPPVVMQIQDLRGDPGGEDATSNIIIRNCILHDSFNNDILKVNNGAKDIRIEGNIFYNQTGSDEHMDVNSVRNVVIEGNIFMNDFEGSGRVNTQETSAFVVVKDSNQDDDGVVGSRDVFVRGNVFLHYQGGTGTPFLLLGEDGQAYHEVDGVTVENNLFLGDSTDVMRAAFGVKGGRNIVFRHNTITGDLPSNAFAMRLNIEGDNPNNANINFYQNIWSDPTGTMGSTGSNANDFSDTPPGETDSFTLRRNLYWNGGEEIPTDGAELVNYTDDANRIVASPMLPNPTGIALPRWVPGTGLFGDGSSTIRQAFEKLVNDWGVPAEGSSAIDAGIPGDAPAVDILGRPRDGQPDLGAVERGEPVEPATTSGYIVR